MLPSDPDDMNEVRSDAAADTVRHFAKKHSETGPGLVEQNISDLLCNLGHYCDREGFRLSDCLRRAASHYTEETGRTGAQLFSEIDG